MQIPRTLVIIYRISMYLSCLADDTDITVKHEDLRERSNKMQQQIIALESKLYWSKSRFNIISNKYIFRIFP